MATWQRRVGLPGGLRHLGPGWGSSYKQGCALGWAQSSTLQMLRDRAPSCLQMSGAPWEQAPAHPPDWGILPHPHYHTDTTRPGRIFLQLFLSIPQDVTFGIPAISEVETRARLVAAEPGPLHPPPPPLKWDLCTQDTSAPLPERQNQMLKCLSPS